jgi:acetyl-CoA carboxylase carboxyltransferase component
MRDLIERLRKVKKEAKLGGGIEKLKKIKEKGKLTPRERIDLLLDKGSFEEINLLVKYNVKAPGDGIIIGHGTINGRKVCVFSHDASVFGGSQGYMHGKKLYKIYEIALKSGIPIIGLNDSPGARVIKPDLAGSDDPYKVSDEKHAGVVFYINTKCSGTIPQISAILGNCTGGSVYSPAMTDFIFMVDGISRMFITGPKVIERVTGEKVDMETLGGSEIHSKITGLCDVRIKTEADCFKEIRELLSYLPSNYKELPPEVKTDDSPIRETDEIENIIPKNPKISYDVKKVIEKIVDNGKFFEIKKEFAPEVVTGFARMNGNSVGIVANQPMVKAGCMTVDSSYKQGRFIRFCDSFNLPVVLFVDTPGYLPGKEQEYQGIIRHGAKVLYALSEATVPKIAILLRKVYGGAALGMGILPGFGTDFVFALPTSEIGPMGAEQAVQLFYRDEIEKSEDRENFLKEKIGEYRKEYADSIAIASKVTYIDDIIEPKDIRKYIISHIELLKNKLREPFKNKWHGNIQL